jgi:RNA polymerase sigma factor (sigma-70 family)
MKGKGGGSVLWSIQTLFDAGSATGMTDRQLLEQFLGRQAPAAEAAFGALVAHHGPMVWNICRGILSDPHAAEDAFHATFLILVRKASSIRRRETLGPWLYGVARRVAVRAKASVARRRERESQGIEMQAASVPNPVTQEEIDALHQEIDRLPEKYRAVVVLCHLEGLSGTASEGTTFAARWGPG